MAVNALRHGLSVPVLADPVLATGAAELAERIADGSADPEVRELAVNVASAQIDVERVRHARHALIAPPAIGASGTESRPGRLRDRIRELVTLDRYERRAISRRRSAIRALQAARFHSNGGAQ
ncbi:MAG: hypothetical protein K2Z80_15395 [Xanthobacteraceae bacterium]|nr:hypothetical protein [Xanthobacteraceae bacterium]